MADHLGRVQASVSTWRQPLPSSASRERDALVRAVSERVLALGDHRLRVGIDGLTAAGKTSFGHELAEWISRTGRPVLRACLDDFKRPWRDRHLYDRESGEGYYHNAFDYQAITELLLKPCGPGGSGSCVLCSIDPLTQVDHSDVLATVASNAVLIVDGVFAFRPELNTYWDFRVWLDIHQDLSVRRGVERDHALTAAEGQRLHRDRYLAAEQLYLAQVHPRERADVLVDNTVFTRPLLLTDPSTGS